MPCCRTRTTPSTIPSIDGPRIRPRPACRSAWKPRQAILVFQRRSAPIADASLITALAAVGGSLVGGLSSFATTYITQRHQVRRERIARELERREALYAQFIEQAAALFLDSLDKDLDDPARLVSIGAVIARIRLTADAAVSRAVEAVMHEIVASYHRPPVAPREIFAQTRETFTDPLAGFTQACRQERDAMLRAL